MSAAGDTKTQQLSSKCSRYSGEEMKIIITLCVLYGTPGDIGEIRQGFLEVVLSKVLGMG